MLFVVAGPIGNLKDITLRALEILKEVDLIACEDTRRTGLLLNHYSIKTPMLPYHDFNKKQQIPKLLTVLREGKKVALFSDAGTPTISDPGFKLVRACIDENIVVSPIPGPCAALAALSASGQPTDKFLFVGFLPKQGGKRLKLLKSIVDCQVVSSAVFYESPFRIVRLLGEINEVFGKEASVTICSEITKFYERLHKATVEELLKEFAGKTLKGEFTVVLGLK